MRKAVSGITLSLLLIGMFALSFSTHPVKAAAAEVYIRADGSVDPPTAPMQRNGSIYTLTGNITTSIDGIWIERSNVILDGAGYTVQGSGGTGSIGVYSRGENSLTIKNFKISGFSSGIMLDESSDNTISGNIITANLDYGIWLMVSSNNVIRNNTISNNYYSSLYMYSTSNTSITENKVTANDNNGINIGSSSSNSIIGNNITGNSGSGIFFWGSYSHNVSGNQIANNGDGIRLDSSRYNVISGNNITNNLNGISGESWSNNEIVGNVLTNNLLGIYIGFQSNYNTIAFNSIKNHFSEGISMWSCSYNTIFANDIIDNNQGGFGAGIVIGYASDNKFSHNNIINNGKQIVIQGTPANTWDDGYPSGGNYWSDYSGVDLNNDGIGDTPYVIDADNIDRYPLMNAVTSIVNLYPSIILTEEGKIFNVSIMAARFQNLWAWQVGIQWDPTYLEYVSYTWGEFQTFAGASKLSPPTIDTVIGKTSKPALESALGSLGAPVSATEVKLLTMTFKVIRSGTCSLRLIDVLLRSQNLTDTTAYPRWSDTDGDGVVNDKDVTLTCTCWEGGYYNPTVDFNDDDVVDITDISIVTSDYNKNTTDPEWGVTNTIHDVPTAVVSAQVKAQSSKVYISVPYHSQRTGYYCGPAALEMVFDYYGPDIPQIEIADVARTSSSYGTFTCDMVRAAHFSNLSTSVGKESPLSFTGYTARTLGYAAFEQSGITLDDLKALLAAGYPIGVLGPWHFRVAVGYNSTHFVFQDPYRAWGPNYTMTYATFLDNWEGGHWGLFVSPWKVDVSNARNVSPGDIFEVTATITYTWAPPFPKEFPASMASATINLPEGLALVPGETAKKVIGTGDFAAGQSATVTWTVQAQGLGGYVISVEAEGRINGFLPPVPPDYSEYYYEDRIGGVDQSIVVVISGLDETPPTTVDDYDGVWHNQSVEINLTAIDDLSGVMETYYRINDGPTKTLSLDGQPIITIEGDNNTLEYWSEDWVGNVELPHKLLFEIKLDKTRPTIGVPSRTPSGDVQSGQEVKVTVAVADTLSGVKNVTLFYTVDHGISWEKLNMNYNVHTSLYETTIPGQPVGTLVMFKIVAHDHAGNIAVNDNLGKYHTYTVRPPPLFVSIRPLSASINVGYSIKFIPTVTGGVPLYSYQWYLNDNPVPNATSSRWTFTPDTSGTYYIHLRVMDAEYSTTQSETSIVVVAAPPVGGYSLLIEGQPTANPLALYLAVTIILATIYTMFRRKKTQKETES